MTETKRKNWLLWLPAIFALVFVSGMWTGLRFSESQSSPIVDVKGDNRIEELLRYIEARYVDEINRDSLITMVIETVLNQLDPHSGYIPGEKIERINEDLRGTYQGVGLEFVLQKDTPFITSVMREGPAWKAGIKPGFIIQSVDNTDLIKGKVPSENIVNLVRGKENTSVFLNCIDYSQNPVQFTLTRAKIPSSSVSSAYMINASTGYIKLSRFSGNAYRDFMKALEEMITFQSMENLIIDLRGNPGGLLEESTKIINQLIPEKDQIILTTKGAHSGKVEYKSTGRAFFKLNKMVVLIDEKSASASEILAGTLQDLGKAIIIGRPSFGKGLVQEQYNLYDGSAIRLSVSRFFTPSGKAIQKPFKKGKYLEDASEQGGIVPDIVVEEKQNVADLEKYRIAAFTYIKNNQHIVNRLIDSSGTYLLQILEDNSLVNLDIETKGEIANMLFDEGLKIQFINRFDPDLKAATNWVEQKMSKNE